MSGVAIADGAIGASPVRREDANLPCCINCTPILTLRLPVQFVYEFPNGSDEPVIEEAGHKRVTSYSVDRHGSDDHKANPAPCLSREKALKTVGDVQPLGEEEAMAGMTILFAMATLLILIG